MERKLNVGGGELRDYPGHWKITARIEGETAELSVIRKPDGTYWEIAAVHIFPPGGGDVRFDIGNQITDGKELFQCEEYYAQLQEKLAEQEQEPGIGDIVRIDGEQGQWKVVGMRDANEPRFQVQKGNDAATQVWVATAWIKVIEKYKEPSPPGIVPEKGIMG